MWYLIVSIPDLCTLTYFEDIMVLNNVTKFHKILIKTTGLIDGTPSKMVKFHEQRAITPEGMVQYGSFSNLKKTLWYLTM